MKVIRQHPFLITLLMCRLCLVYNQTRPVNQSLCKQYWPEVKHLP
nr:MAG TPA: hypothetical protein [Caudoviricetes sp.]